MQRIIIFGNSGSGKSTLAKKLASENQLAHLDLDTLAWLATTPPQRKSLVDSSKAINLFTQSHDNWVIEGCYSDLIELLINHSTSAANEIIYLDLPIDTCIENAGNRPWEPHKYASKQEQDANLSMLIDWIKAYETRTDSFSKNAHQKIFDAFAGKKRSIKNNS